MSTTHTAKNDVKISKFLSLVLRHEPEAIGLHLDTEGWADIGELINKAAKNGRELTREDILRVVAESDKKRFGLSEDGLRIRAVQGHSTKAVDIDFVPKAPPDLLFHGTAKRFLESIRVQGLAPGDRQYVHLSADAETATAVGTRHGKPIVLTVRAGAMADAGVLFYLSENGVWLTREVPPQYLEE